MRNTSTILQYMWNPGSACKLATLPTVTRYYSFGIYPLIFFIIFEVYDFPFSSINNPCDYYMSAHEFSQTLSLLNIKVTWSKKESLFLSFMISDYTILDIHLDKTGVKCLQTNSFGFNGITCLKCNPILILCLYVIL